MGVLDHVMAAPDHTLLNGLLDISSSKVCVWAKGISICIRAKRDGGSGSDSEALGPRGQSLRASSLTLPLGRAGYIYHGTARETRFAGSNLRVRGSH